MIQEARIFGLFPSQGLLQLWKAPHICFTGYLWTTERQSIHSQERHFSTPTAKTMKALAARCYHLPIYSFTCKVMHPLVMSKPPLGFQFLTSCWHHPFGVFLPYLLKICVLFSVKSVLCGSTCCSWVSSGLRIQARASRNPRDACAVGGTLVWLSQDPALASVCHHPAAGGAALPQRHKTEVRANCHH